VSTKRRRSTVFRNTNKQIKHVLSRSTARYRLSAAPTKYPSVSTSASTHTADASKEKDQWMARTDHPHHPHGGIVHLWHHRCTFWYASTNVNANPSYEYCRSSDTGT